MTEKESTSRLSPAMRWVLIGAGTVVVIGAIVVGWLLTSAGYNSDGADGGSASRTPTQGPLPDATPISGSEVLPPSGAAQDGIPPRPTDAPETPAAPPTPLLALPFPGSATADGGLVAGFPRDIMGPLPDSDVIASAIATEGEVMQVTLEGRADASREDIRAFYADKWAALGLSDENATDGSLAFSGRGAALALTQTTGGAGDRYTIFAVFRAA